MRPVDTPSTLTPAELLQIQRLAQIHHEYQQKLQDRLQSPSALDADRAAASGRVVDLGNGTLVLERTAEESAAVDAHILAEFNGDNHAALAYRFRVSFQHVYRLIQQAQREAAAAARRVAVQNADEVLWVAPVNGLALLSALEAVTLTAGKARAQGRLDSLAVALVLLPPGQSAADPADNPLPPVVPAESRPAPQDRAANPPPAAL